MVVSSDTILRRNPDLLASEMDGETVMLDIESGHYFGLSGAGPHIWNLLEQDRSAGAIVESVSAEFAGASDDSVAQDVMDFLQKLVDKGLVTVVA